MATLLVIDDDTGMHHILTRISEKNGHTTHCANDLASGLTLAKKVAPDLIFLDVMLPDGSGLDMIPSLKALTCQPEIIIITAFGTSDGAALALQHGAWDYVQKNTPVAEMRLLLQRALETQAKHVLSPSILHDYLLGESWLMRHCLELARLYAKNDNNVLITGETGTGKELFARYIHENSERKQHPFVIVDCASIPDELASSILFGHKKGSFTNAVDSHIGLIAEAEGGTLFLDELGELPLHMQKIFLRVLQERRYRPVGSSNEQAANIRLIAATNRNIPEMVQEKTFRSDLFYRIQTCLLALPPLRNREDDLILLAQHFQEAICSGRQIARKKFSLEFIESLKGYFWPGNVRELKNVMEFTMSLADNAKTLYPQHLPLELRIFHAQNTFAQHEHSDIMHTNLPEALALNWDAPPTLMEYREHSIKLLEKYYLSELIARSVLGFEDCRVISGLSRSRFYAVLKKHALESPNIAASYTLNGE